MTPSIFQLKRLSGALLVAALCAPSAHALDLLGGDATRQREAAQRLRASAFEEPDVEQLPLFDKVLQADAAAKLAPDVRETLTQARAAILLSSEDPAQRAEVFALARQAAGQQPVVAGIGHGGGERHRRRGLGLGQRPHDRTALRADRLWQRRTQLSCARDRRRARNHFGWHRQQQGRSKRYVRLQ